MNCVSALHASRQDVVSAPCEVVKNRHAESLRRLKSSASLCLCTAVIGSSPGRCNFVERRRFAQQRSSRCATCGSGAWSVSLSFCARSCLQPWSSPPGMFRMAVSSTASRSPLKTAKSARLPASARFGSSIVPLA